MTTGQATGRHRDGEQNPIDDTQRTQVPTRWITCFAFAWLGVWIAQNTPAQLLLPQQIGKLYVRESAAYILTAFGITVALAGIASMVIYPIVGHLSDRTTSRYGRRRPWILGGAATMAAGLVVLSLQATVVGAAISWIVVTAGFCALTAGLTALLSDQVPQEQLGRVSAWMSIQQAFGGVIGMIIVGTLLVTQFGAYLGLAATVVVLTVPLVLCVPDPPLQPSAPATVTATTTTPSIRIHSLRDSDFRWTAIQALVLNLGNALGLGLLLYFLEFAVRVENPVTALTGLSIVYTVTVIAASLTFSALSDRWGRRRVFVFVGALGQAAATGLLALNLGLTAVFVAAVVLGVGYGMYAPALQAQAAQALPNPATRGEDMSLVYAAVSASASLSPLAGSLIVSYAGGFPSLFLIASALSLMGALAVSRVRGIA